MKKWIQLVLFMLSVVILSACGKSLEKQILEQLDLGQKFLSEEDYEEAVVAFQKVIELDDKNVEGYLKLSEAYIGLGRPEEAGKVLETGYEKTQDSRLQEALEALTAKMEAVEAGQEASGAEEGQKETEGQEGSGGEETVPETEIPRGTVTGEITVEAQIFLISDEMVDDYLNQLGDFPPQLEDGEGDYITENASFEIHFLQPVEIEDDGEIIQVQKAEFYAAQELFGDEGQLYDFGTETVGPLLEKTITIQGYLVKAQESSDRVLPDTGGLPYYYKVNSEWDEGVEYHLLVAGPYGFYPTGYTE